MLTLIDTADTEGAAPCHIDYKDNTVVIANYMGGSLTRFSIKKDGKFGEAVVFSFGANVGPNKER